MNSIAILAVFALVSSCAVQMASAERATTATISAPVQPGTDVLKSAGAYSVPVGVIFFSFSSPA